MQFLEEAHFDLFSIYFKKAAVVAILNLRLGGKSKNQKNVSEKLQLFSFQ